jgi:hypothetical protein
VLLSFWTRGATDNARSILTSPNGNGEDGASSYEHHPRVLFVTLTVSGNVALFAHLFDCIPRFLAQDRDKYFLKEYGATSTQYLGITRA